MFNNFEYDTDKNILIAIDIFFFIKTVEGRFPKLKELSETTTNFSCGSSVIPQMGDKCGCELQVSIFSIVYSTIGWNQQNNRKNTLKL